MKLTRGEFCQFNLNTRFELLKEFGKNILKKRVRMKLVSIYRISDFYVEVYESLASHQIEKVEPLRHSGLIDMYKDL